MAEAKPLNALGVKCAEASREGGRSVRFFFDMFNDLSAALDYWLYEMYTNEVSIELVVHC